jgi:hypothetical protein
VWRLQDPWNFVGSTLGNAFPVITGIPQLEAIREAIATMDRTDKDYMLAWWDDYGYATYGQLKLMDTVVTAKTTSGWFTPH